MQPEELLVLPLWYAVFLLSVTAHEAAHAFAAYRGGDSTAYHGGQVTLNPIPHIRREPFGTVLVPLMSFVMLGWTMGWASAPYDPVWAQRHPRRAALMAAAGPAANLLLATIAFVALKLGVVARIWGELYTASDEPGKVLYQLDYLVQPLADNPGALEAVGRLCSIMLTLNLLLFLFNLVPLPPLDGAAILAGLHEPSRRMLEQLRESAMGGLIGLLVAIYALQWLFDPVYRLVLDLLFGGSG